MKIVTIVSNLGIGGTQRCAQNYAIAYKRLGYDSRVGTLRGAGPRRDYLEANGVGIVGEKLQETIAAIQNERPELVHLHRSDSLDQDAITVLRTARLAGCRTIQTNVFSRPDFSASSYLVDVDLQLSDWCLEKWLWRAKGVRRKPISAILPYFVDERSFHRVSPDEIEDQRSRWGVPRGSVVFGRIGQPLDSKWSPDILDGALRSAVAAENCYFVFVGAPDSIRRRFEASSFAARVVFVPPMNDDLALRKCYSAFDYFLHSAEMGESFGMVLAESILCETPIITRARIARDNTQAELVVGTGGGWVAWGDRQLSSLIDAAASGMLSCDMRDARERLVNEYGVNRCDRRLAAVVNVVMQHPQEAWARNLQQSGVAVRLVPAGVTAIARSLGGKVRLGELLLFHMTHHGRLYRALKYLKFRAGKWLH